MKFIFRHSLYRKLIVIILLCLVTPFLMVTLFLYRKIWEDMAQRDHLNLELVISQAENVRQEHLNNIYTISDKILSNNALNGFLLTEYSSEYLQSYINESGRISGNLYDKTYDVKIYCVNETIPRGFSIFYHLSDISSSPGINAFLQSEETEKWVTPEGSGKFPNLSFTEFENHYTYLRKAQLQNNLLYLLTISISQDDFDSFLSENYSASPDMDRQLYRTEDYILVSYSDRIADRQFLEENMDALKRKSEIFELSFDRIPQKIIYYWPSDSWKKYFTAAIIAFSLFAASAITIVFLYVRKIFKSIFVCIRQFDNVLTHNLYNKLPVNGDDELSRIKIAFNVLIDKIHELIRLTKEQCAIAEESRLQMLQQQINPHFMYNTLEAFSYKMELYGHYEESDAIASFSRMLRYNITSRSKFASLRDEVDLALNYLSIQKMKYDNISFDIQIPEELYSMEIPRFCLQPIIENSIMHGYDNRPLKIKLFCSDLGNEVLIRVYDNGKGIPSRKLSEINSGLREHRELPSTGIGLTNINGRLKLFYSEKYFIKLDSVEGQWTAAAFQIPR